jgi:DNA-binding NarL/FixJ family response regulator
MVLLELRSPRCKGVSAVKFLRQRYPHIPLVVVSGDEEFSVINKVMSNGASGFIGKSSPEAMFLGALRLVLSGDTYVPPQMFRHLSNPKEYRLTRRQSQMLGCLIEGLSNKEISECLDLAEGTVKVHIAAVYQVLRVRNRREAVAVAGQIGFGRASAGHGYQGAMAREYGRMV